MFEGSRSRRQSRCFYHHADDVTLRDSLCATAGARHLGADSDSARCPRSRRVYGCGDGDQRHQIYMATTNDRFPQAVFPHAVLLPARRLGGNGVKFASGAQRDLLNWIEGSYYHELELIGADGPARGRGARGRRRGGNVIVKTGGHPQHFAVRIGGDGTGQSYGRYRFVNNTFVMAASSSAVFRLFDGIESFEAHNNVLYRAGGGAVNVIDDGEVTWLGGTPRISGSRNWVSSGSSDAPASGARPAPGRTPVSFDVGRWICGGGRRARRPGELRAGAGGA